eukprot:12613616-Ditylum_brightwellii.AAC.1
MTKHKKEKHKHDKKDSTSWKEIILEQQVLLGGEEENRTKVGYHIQKTISIPSSSSSSPQDENTITVTTQLTNLGDDAFTTPWYSHHFFTCDDKPVGDGYNLQLGLKPVLSSLNDTTVSYEESGVGIWSTPLENYAHVSPTALDQDGTYDAIQIQMYKEIEDGIKIKAEFPKCNDDNGYEDASFTLRACHVSMKEDIPEIQQGTSSSLSDISMFAYNVYMEHGTISPEPIILVELGPGESKEWTQRIELTSHDDEGIFMAT